MGGINYQKLVVYYCYTHITQNHLGEATMSYTHDWGMFTNIPPIQSMVDDWGMVPPWHGVLPAFQRIEVTS